MTRYQQRLINQVLLWVEGRPTHNMVDDECCPDFSCCEPEMFISARGERQAYFDALKHRIEQVVQMPEAII